MAQEPIIPGWIDSWEIKSGQTVTCHLTCKNCHGNDAVNTDDKTYLRKAKREFINRHHNCKEKIKGNGLGQEQISLELG